VEKKWSEAEGREPDLMAAERQRLRERPLGRSANPRRTQPLQGPLASVRIEGRALPQWQHEVTGAGRIWYCPDKDERVVWVTMVNLAHPKRTD
jgi:hypothetical protein